MQPTKFGGAYERGKIAVGQERCKSGDRRARGSARRPESVNRCLKQC